MAERGLDQRDREIATAELVANARITQDELELEYQKLSDEKRFALEERGLVITENMTAAQIQNMNREMNLSEERLALEKTSMDNAEAARAFQEQMALADRLGYYIDVNGETVPTLAATNAAREIELRERGLDIEADRLAASSEQFTQQLNQQVEEFAKTHDLNLRETEALIARTNADIADQKARLNLTIEQMDDENAIAWENLRLRGVEIEAGREATEEEMAFRREQLAIQIEQQNMDRANDMFKFSEQMELSVREFETLNDRWETEWAFSTEQAAKEFGLKEEEFLMLKFQVEQDVRLRGESLDNAAAQWAAEFGLDEQQVLQALRHGDALFEEQLQAMALENDLSEQELQHFKNQMEKFNKQEDQRDSAWEMLWNPETGEGIDWDDEDAVRQFAAHMALLNNATSLGGGSQGGMFDDQPGLIESITGFGTEWLIEEFGDEVGNRIREKLGLPKKKLTEVVDDIVDPTDAVSWAGKIWGVSEDYQWDENVSYVQNVLQGNPKLAAVGAKISPFVGPLAVIAGTTIAAYKTWEFFGGAREELWKDAGVTLPRQYAKNFYPPNPVDKDGDPVNIGSQPGLYLHWADGVARWTAAGGQGGVKGTYDEPLDEFMQRTGRRVMSTEPLIEQSATPSGAVAGAGEAIHEQMMNYINPPDTWTEQGLSEPPKPTREEIRENAERDGLWVWDDIPHFDTFVSKPYDELNDRNKSRLDRLGLAVSLGLSIDDMVELDLTNKYFPEVMVVDDEGILFFDQDFSKGSFKRSHYVETDMNEMSSRFN